MKRLHIGASSIVTGDDLADAILEFSSALYSSGHIETIGVPFIDDGGVPQVARLQLTPALALWATTVSRDGAEPRDPDLVTSLRERSASLRRSTEQASRAFDHFDL
jgi:hypothetical protein